MPGDKNLSTCSIQEAVLYKGGNGLSSPAFQPPLDFLLIFGWLNVEQGVEALVCNGEILDKTKLKSDFLRLVGRRSFFHRVLLKPAPLEVRTQALSNDHIDVELDVSVKYEVIDPIYVTSASNPKIELENLLTGVISECIHAYDSVEIISQNAGIKESIKLKLDKSHIIERHYAIVELLKVMPLIDKRLIDINLRTREALLEKDLLEAEGKNREVIAKHDLIIAQNEETFQEDIKQRDHERKMQEMQILERAAITKEALKALGEIGKSGIDPSNVAKEVIGSLVNPVQNRRIGPQIPAGMASAQLEDGGHKEEEKSKQFIDREYQALQSIKEKLGITSIEIPPSDTTIKGAIIQFHDYEIIFVCNAFYPDEKPDALVRYRDGTEIVPEEYWIEGVSNLLAQALLVIVNQV